MKTIGKNGHNDTNEDLLCCENLNGLCNWIEPPSPEIDEHNRKSSNWTESDCRRQFPCDLMKILERYNKYLDAEKEAANNVVITTNYIEDK